MSTPTGGSAAASAAYSPPPAYSPPAYSPPAASAYTPASSGQASAGAATMPSPTAPQSSSAAAENSQANAELRRRMSELEGQLRKLQEKNKDSKGEALGTGTVQSTSLAVATDPLALHKAAYQGDAISLALHLEMEFYRKRLNTFNHNGMTPLGCAAYAGKKETFDILLNTEGTRIRMKDRDGLTALHWAANVTRETKPNEAIHYAMCKALLEKGADVNALSELQRTPIHLAREQNCLTIIALLQEYGAKEAQKKDAGCVIL